MDFLRHIANGLLAVQQRYRLELVLLLPVDNRIETPVDALHVMSSSLRSLLRGARPWYARPRPAFNESLIDYFTQIDGGRIETVYYGNSPSGLLRALRRIGADVILPVNGTLGREYPVPWVSYLPDFQHRYLPQNFAANECADRDRVFSSILTDAVVAVVHSRAVKDDIGRFYPNSTTRIYNLPFAPCPLAEWFEDLPADVISFYDLPQRYFIISNQFWVHKDHKTAFQALSRLDGGDKVGIVCTGPMQDYRKPGYVVELLRQVEQFGLSDRIRFLGLVPKRHQIEIMKNAIAVLQPTLFEGAAGGGSVYDAVSLGVPAIVSDIPVNLELGGEVRYFRAGESIDLADQMREVMNDQPPRPCCEDLLRRGLQNLENLGDRVMAAVSCVAQG
jgi:glycosyltransferase involved in cell wall biosynthesis